MSNVIVVGYGRRLIRIKRTNTYVTNFYSCNPTFLFRINKQTSKDQRCRAKK